MQATYSTEDYYLKYIRNSKTATKSPIKKKAREPEKIVLKRNSNDQQIHDKNTLKTTNYLENENQSHMKYYLTLSDDYYY